jgi:hypothetical protein
LASTDFSEPEIDRFVMPITAAEAIVRHNTLHQIELPHVAVELNQSGVPHASHHFHPVLRDCLDLDSCYRLRSEQNIQPGKRQHSLPQVRGLPGLPLAPSIAHSRTPDS